MVTLDDRIAAGLHANKDLVALSRRPLMTGALWAAILCVLMIAHTAWFESRGNGLSGFAREFVAALFGPSGVPLAVVLAWAAMRYARHSKAAERHSRRWARDAGHDRPLPVSYRFEPRGLLVTAPRRRQIVACRRIIGVSETPGHLFIGLKDMDDAYVLARQGLSAEDMARIQAWAASCHIEGAGAKAPFEALSTSADPEPALSARFTVTEVDRQVALTWQLNHPIIQQRTRRNFAYACFFAALLPPAALCFGWLIDPERVPLDYALPLLTDMLPGAFLYVTVPIWAIIGLTLLVFPSIRRWEIRGYARHLQQNKQVDEHEMRGTPAALEVEEDGLLSIFDWSDFSGLERRGEHFLLLRREDQPLILPLRALHGDQREQFERIFATRIGGGREANRMEA